MSYQETPISTTYTRYERQDEYELDDDNEEYIEEDRDVDEQDDSDEGKSKVMEVERSFRLLLFFILYHFYLYT
jgi:hypothetical protein